MKRLLAILMIAVMLCGVLAACNTPEPEVSKTDDTSKEPENVVYGEDLEIRDLNGRVIRVLCQDYNAQGSGSILGFGGEIIQREEYSEDTASAVDVAKAEVRRLIEERYNCTITGKIAPGSQTSVITGQIASGLTGEGAYDILFDNVNATASQWLDGVYLDLNDIETIDLTNPWWDQMAVNDLSLDGKLFVAMGDINTQDNDGTWIIFFNKRLAAEKMPEVNFYEMVDNDEWNFDNFVSICKGFTYDSNGDGSLDEFDTWALGTELYNVYVHALAGGQRIAAKDDDDMPYLTFQTEGMYDALGAISDFYSDTETVMIANDGRFNNRGYGNVWEETIIKAFTDGRELFYMGGLMNLTGFRSMEDDFGMLPIPKMNAEQDRYYHSVSPSKTSALSIPSNVLDPEDLGLVIEALAAMSKNKVTPEYYDRTLKLQASRDDESGRMLDIIFESRVFDLANIYGWGNVTSAYYYTDSNYVSRFESVANRAQADMENTVEGLME